MVSEIRIYVEGGGTDNPSKRRVRAGFVQFLESIARLARERRIRWSLIPCGPRDVTFKNFRTALRTHPEALNILLVDSESHVTRPPLEHLQQQAGWSCAGLEEEQCHLMVHVVESWLLADPQILSEYYGANFHAKAIPARQDVEAIEKRDVMAALERATEGTQKGRYHKTRHCPDLLERIRPDAVRQRARHCDRLFTTLKALLESS